MLKLGKSKRESIFKFWQLFQVCEKEKKKENHEEA